MPVSPGFWLPTQSAVAPQWQKFWVGMDSLYVPHAGSEDHAFNLAGAKAAHLIPGTADNIPVETTEVGPAWRFDTTTNFLEATTATVNDNLGGGPSSGGGPSHGNAMSGFCLIRIDNKTGDHRLMSQWGAVDRWLLWYDDGSAEESWAVSINSTGFNIDAGIDTGPAGGIAVDTWYHVGFTFDGTTLTIYVDGVVSDTDTNAAMVDLVVATDPMRLGSINDTGTNSLEGYMAIAYTWYRALSFAEVQRLARDPFGPIRPALWPQYPAITTDAAVARYVNSLLVSKNDPRSDADRLVSESGLLSARKVT